MLYVAAVLYTHLVVFLSRRVSFGVSFLLCSPLIAFSTYRGFSGKDSQAYHLRFQSLGPDGFNVSLDSEPFLNALIYFAKYVFAGGIELFFFFHSLIVSFLFALVLRKHRQSRVYLYTIAPVFFIDGVTNTMRVTLAYHFFMVGVLYSQSFLSFVGVFCSHVSGVVLYPFRSIVDALFKSGWRAFFYVFGLIIVIAALSAFYLFYGGVIETLFPRVFGKVNKYQEMVLPGLYSGIVDLFMLLSLSVIVGSFNYFSINLKRFIFSSILGFIICLALYSLVQQSLAFIRVVKLVLIAFCFSSAVLQASKKVPTVCLVFLGCIYSANFIRQVFMDDGFLPYARLPDCWSCY